MKNLLYPLHNYFEHYPKDEAMRTYPIEVQYDMLAELGYTGVYISPTLEEDSLAEFKRFGKVAEERGLKPAGLYHVYQLSEGNRPQSEELWPHILEHTPAGTRLELAFTNQFGMSDEDNARDREEAKRIIEKLLPETQKAGLKLEIYPHFGFTVARQDEALELCETFGAENLKYNFTGFHWYHDHKHNDLYDLLTRSAPYLGGANLCGTSKGGRVAGNSIEPLGPGQMDNFAVLSLLFKVGLEGPIGFQAYDMMGDPYYYLKQTKEAFDEMLDRLERHPEWAEAIIWPSSK